MYRLFLKAFIDKFFTFIMILTILPLVLFVIIILFITNKGKVFYFQQRPGKNGKIFTIIKFKTMNDKKDKDGNLLPDEKRLTYIGRIVRKLSIDEIPQLINVLIGDMSLIGPRPLLIEYLPLYNSFQSQRHHVKPGITGWAQINGRNAISWKQKFEYDVWYVENYSFLIDLKIIILTIKRVFRREGISSETSATMEKFKGNN